MGKHIWIILVLLLCMVGVSEAQVTPGTVSSKTLDGVGNKITSTVVGADTGLDVNIIGGGGGGPTYLDADGIVNQTTNAVHGQTYMYNGATWDRVRGAILTGLEVNCVTGCSGGASTPTDAFANPTTAGLQQTFNMGFNGVTWDRLRSSIASGLEVNVTDAFLLDATFTGRFVAAYVDADAIANQTTTAVHGQSYFYNGVTWDRMRGSVVDGLLVNLGANNDVTVTSGTITLSNAFLLDATFTGRFPVAYVDADTIANQTTTAIHGQNYMYNGVTWDRMRGTIAGGLLVDVSDLFLLDATLTARFPTGSTPADNESNAVTISRIGNFNYIFDGATWDRWTGAVSQSGTWNIGTVTTVTTVGTLTTITNPVTVLGNKTNNNAAPGATNVGVLPCIATAAVPASTEGNQVGCSTNLSGAQRVINESSIATANLDGSCPSGAASFTVAASNASRTWLAMWASPANTDDVYIKLGATATSADGRFAPGQPINFTSGRIYTGVVDAFPNSGTQAVCVMELN
jgi:hypothetical protein